jgi:hypothetical protein
VAAVRTIFGDTGRVIRKTDSYFVALARFLGRPMQWRPYTFVQSEFDKIWELAGPGETVDPTLRPQALTRRIVRDRFRRAIRYEVRRLGIDLSPADVEKLADRLSQVLDQIMDGTASIDDITAMRMANRAVGSSRTFAEFVIRKPQAESKYSDPREMLRKIFEENLALQKPTT